MNTFLLLFFVCTCFTVHDIECKGGRGGFGRSGGRGWGGGRSWGGRGHTWSSGSSGRHTYPSSSSGLSGSSGSHSYPSHNGLSGGYGSSGSHSYPSHSGMSGSSGSRLNPTHVGGSGSSYGSSWTNSKPSYGSGSSGSGYTHYNLYGRGYGYVPYSYHSAPQTVYIHQYRNTDSRYSDILTGLALYNLGRSHTHHYHHYYEDDYYRGRYSSGTHQPPYDVPSEKAKCYLRISGEGKEQRLSIPCEIVSTFSDDSEKVQTNTSTNMVVCKNVTVPAKIANRFDNNKSNFKFVDLNEFFALDLSDPEYFNRAIRILDDMEAELGRGTTNGRVSTTSSTTETAQRTPENTGVTPSPSYAAFPVTTDVTTDSQNSTFVIRTMCTNVTGTDPLSQKGQKVEVTPKMKCAVEIETGTSLLRHRIDCKTLEAYSKMPEPKKESTLTPSRNTLKSWMNSPPWWLSMFIAV